MGGDKGKQPEDNTWVCKALVKENVFDLEYACVTFMEAEKRFVEASTLGSRDKPYYEMDPYMFMTFLESCMKVPHDSKALEGLQELINRCARNTLGDSRVVWKISKHKART